MAPPGGEKGGKKGGRLKKWGGEQGEMETGTFWGGGEGHKMLPDVIGAFLGGEEAGKAPGAPKI